MPTARDTLLLGLHGEVQAGEEIPETYIDSVGETQATDFAELAARGLLADDTPDESADDSDEYDALLKADLEKLVDARELDVTGTGKNDAVTADDLRYALRADDADALADTSDSETE